MKNVFFVCLAMMGLVHVCVATHSEKTFMGTIAPPPTYQSATNRARWQVALDVHPAQRKLDDRSVVGCHHLRPHRRNTGD